MNKHKPKYNEETQAAYECNVIRHIMRSLVNVMVNVFVLVLLLWLLLSYRHGRMDTIMDYYVSRTVRSQTVMRTVLQSSVQYKILPLSSVKRLVKRFMRIISSLNLLGIVNFQ